MASYDKDNVLRLCCLLRVVDVACYYIVGRCCFVKGPSPTCAKIKLSNDSSGMSLKLKRAKRTQRNFVALVLVPLVLCDLCEFYNFVCVDA